MSSVVPDEGVNHDETDTVLLMMLDRDPPPLEENSFGNMVSNLTGWCSGYSSAVIAGLEADITDVGEAASSTRSHDLAPAGADTAGSRAVGASGSLDGDLALPSDTHQEFFDSVKHREMNR